MCHCHVDNSEQERLNDNIVCGVALMTMIISVIYSSFFVLNIVLNVCLKVVLSPVAFARLCATKMISKVIASV